MTPPEVLRGVVRGLHHVAIAVENLADGRVVYEHALGLQATRPEEVPSQGVNVLVMFAGAQRIELVEPVGDEGPVARFLESRGPGIHHIAWLVDDLAAAIKRLKKAKVKMIDHKPQPGSHGTTVAFVHPKATGGVLMELVEDPNAPVH